MIRVIELSCGAGADLARVAAHEYNVTRLARRGRIVWPSAHDWKSCIPQGIEGSNPSLSAIAVDRPPCGAACCLSVRLSSAERQA